LEEEGRAISARAADTATAIEEPEGQSIGGRPPESPAWLRRAQGRLTEAVVVLISPALVYFVLRLREMSNLDLPDPAFHTGDIVAPHDLITRYYGVFAATARNREVARVGFLIPARLAYLAFGAVPGFLATRYFFALVAIVPTYLLLRRLYGVAAGALGIVVIMSCPVIVTAWGTDYPDSAAVSYLCGALACLAMPSVNPWRRVWLALAGCLMALAIWSFVGALTVVVCTLGCYALIDLLRAPRKLPLDAAVLAGAFLLTTVLLVPLSGVLLGNFDYVSATVGSLGYLHGVASHWASSNWHWALHRDYLLVPVAVGAIWAAVFLRRRFTDIPTAQLLIGLACCVQFLVFAVLQFGGHLWLLEDHYNSSMLWASVCLALTVSCSELCRPLFANAVARWIPPLAFLLVPLAFEAHRHVPVFAWAPVGFVVAAAAVSAVAVARLVSRGHGSSLAAVAAAVAVAVSVLVLTIARGPEHAPIKGTVSYVAPGYAESLGGSVGNLVADYRVSTELPAFVGNATYPGDQMLMWWPRAESWTLEEPVGIYHLEINSLPSNPPVLTGADRWMLTRRRPAQVLLLSTTGTQFPGALRALGSYRARLVRATVLRSGRVVVYAWLLTLGSFAGRGR
jgi:hypothetical protein